MIFLDFCSDTLTNQIYIVTFKIIFKIHIKSIKYINLHIHKDKILLIYIYFLVQIHLKAQKNSLQFARSFEYKMS